jgi:hypothetical protein
VKQLSLLDPPWLSADRQSERRSLDDEQGAEVVATLARVIVGGFAARWRARSRRNPRFLISVTFGNTRFTRYPG